MKDGLTTVRIGVDNHAVAVIRETLTFGYLSCGDEQVSKCHRVIWLGLGQRVYMFPWNYEDMRRSLRAQIIECDACFILVNEGRRYASVGNLAENTVFATHTLFAY